MKIAPNEPTGNRKGHESQHGTARRLPHGIWLKDISGEQLANLRGGIHHCRIFSVKGKPCLVWIHLSGGKGKLHHACFDFFATDWTIREEALETFRQEYLPDMRERASERAFKMSRVYIPTGGSQITFSIPRGEEAHWLGKAAQFIADTGNLEPVKSPYLE